MPEASVRSEAEVAKLLTEFETEWRPFALAVEGYSVWRLIRFPVGLALQNLPFEANVLPRRPLLRAFIRSVCDLVRSPKMQRYAVKSYVSALRIRSVHGYEDIYFERLLEKVPGGVRLYSFNAPGYDNRQATSVAKAVDTSAVIIIGALLARLFPFHGGETTFAHLSELITNRLGVEGFSAERIRRMFSSFWWQSRLYGCLLRRLGVRTVFAADTGERALLAACQRQGGRFVELQHGVFTPDHPDAVPTAALCDAKASALMLPDVVALYGSYWKARHADTALEKTGRLLSAGASVIEDFRALRTDVFLPVAGNPRLVLTTQGVDRDSLIRFLQQFLLQSRASFELIIKLHPAYDSSVLPYTKILGADSRVKIVAGRDDPSTYELIALADLHLSISSACHYDALGIGVPTVVIGLAGYQLVQDLVDSGDAILVREPEDLVRIVALRSWAPVSPEGSAKYYRHGFVQNMASLIE